MWQWLSNWRARRVTLKALQIRQRDEEVRIADIYPNSLQRALSALDAGDVAEAAKNWEEAKALLPATIVRSEDAFKILLGLERFHEAEALLKRMRRYVWWSHRYAEFYLPSMALLAERRGDLNSALSQWRKLKTSRPDDPVPYIREATCLRELGKLDDAAALFEFVLQKRPDDFYVRLAAAQLSDRRRDWTASLRHWEILAASFGHAPSVAGYARAQMEIGRLEEAKAYLDYALKIYPSNQEIGKAHEEVEHRLSCKSMNFI